MGAFGLNHRRVVGKENVGEGESLNPRVDGIALLCLGYLFELVLDALRWLQKRPLLRGRQYYSKKGLFCVARQQLPASAKLGHTKLFGRARWAARPAGAARGRDGGTGGGGQSDPTPQSVPE